MHWIDPQSLRKISGRVEQFSFNAHGGADGMLLAGDREVHFPPHLWPRVSRHVKPGDAVVIHGVAPRGADVWVAIAIDTPSGVRLEDAGPPAHKKHAKSKHPTPKPEPRPIQVSSTIRRALHGPRGNVHGVLLADGSIARFPPHAAETKPRWFSPGQSIVIEGEAVRVRGCRVIVVTQWGKSTRRLERVE